MLSDNSLAEKLFDRLGHEAVSRPLGELELVARGQLTEQTLLEHYCELSDIPAAEEESFDSLEPLTRVNADFLLEKVILPIAEDKIALAAPYATAPLVRQWLCQFGTIPEFLLARRSLVERKINELYGDTTDDEALPEQENLLDLAKEAPIVRLVNDIFSRAVESDASDIHVEPTEDALIVRYRIDGMLVEAMRQPMSQFSAISSRLKLIGGLNIAERRLPQDGRIEQRIGGHSFDVRMSTLPGMHGESIVLRLLRKDSSAFSIETIGMSDTRQKECRNLIDRPHGLILVVGPTGSGKSTTLYCLLNILNSGSEKIITVEDPVEYNITGVTQMQVNEKTGLTFAAGLRSIVRQDPDIILVGEIRDRETADICINAALTGHLVLSSLHTNDAAGAITRLQDMGVEDYLVASSLTGVLSQRLVRCICPECNGQAAIGDTTCRNCSSTGYRGRTGIYELMKINEEIRRAIIDRENASGIASIALANGMIPIAEDAQTKVAANLTTPEEIARIVNS